MQEQSQLMWKIRDQLQSSLSKSGMQALLRANNQAVPKGESNVSGGGVASGCGLAIVAVVHKYKRATTINFNCR